MECAAKNLIRGCGVSAAEAKFVPCEMLRTGTTLDGRRDSPGFSKFTAEKKPDALEQSQKSPIPISARNLCK